MRRARSGANVLWQECLAPLPDVQDNCAGFEQHKAVFLEDRHLPKRLQRAVVRFVLIALC